MIEIIEELTRPIRLLPRAEAQSIGMALADIMIDEAGNANRIGHN